MRGAEDEALVLLGERQIEAHLDLQVVDLLLARARAQGHTGRIAGHNASDDKDCHWESDQDEQRPQTVPYEKIDKLYAGLPGAIGVDASRRIRSVRSWFALESPRLLPSGEGAATLLSVAYLHVHLYR